MIVSIFIYALNIEDNFEYIIWELRRTGKWKSAAFAEVWSQALNVTFDYVQ
jgi:hypothetical protein